jgi:hypothetical protein
MHMVGGEPAQFCQLTVPPLAFEGLLELDGPVEVVLDRPLAAVGHEDQLADPRGQCFVDGVLDQGPVHDRQHFPGDGFRDRQEARTEAAHRKHGFAHLAMRFADLPVGRRFRGQRVDFSFVFPAE